MTHVSITLGGPGAGKTRHLLFNVLKKELEQGTEPERIAYVSYTRQGTYQGVELARDMFDLEPEQCPYMKTLHSILFHYYELKRDDILSPKDHAFLDKHLGVKNLDDYLTFIDMQRNNTEVAAFMYDELQLDPYTVKYVSLNYKAYKDYFKKYDFTDLIEKAINDKVVLDIDCAVIDEAQDLTTLQWRLCHSLFKKAQRLYLAGDPNQSIYDWAGADYRYFMRLNADEVTVLPKTYRMPRVIWQLGKQVHAMIDVSTPYPQECKEEEGVLCEVSHFSKVPQNKDYTYLYLARANAHLEEIEKEFKLKGILYTNSEGKPSMSKKKLLFIEAYYRYMNNKPLSKKQRDVITHFFEDEEALKALKKEGKNAYEAAFHESLKWFDADYALAIGQARSWSSDYSRIRVATMHKVKGAEADVVVVLTDATKKTMKRFQDNPDAELRVLFVAITRAKHELYIVSTNSKYGYPITAINKGVPV